MELFRNFKRYSLLNWLDISLAFLVELNSFLKAKAYVSGIDLYNIFVGLSFPGLEKEERLACVIGYLERQRK